MTEDRECPACGETRPAQDYRTYRRRICKACVQAESRALAAERSKSRPPRPRRTLEERFWENVEPEPNTGCWLWSGSTLSACGGYGQMEDSRSGRRTVVRAHRFSYELHHGPIPNGLQVCHRCDTPPCVNPDHLFLGTAADNAADKVAKGRARGPSPEGGRRGWIKRPLSTRNMARGERSPSAKLTEQNVREIRERCAAGEMHGTVAADYGVTRCVISAIAARKSWRHVA